MWLGASERLVGELFEQAGVKRKDSELPFNFHEDAESIL